MKTLFKYLLLVVLFVVTGCSERIIGLQDDEILSVSRERISADCWSDWYDVSINSIEDWSWWSTEEWVRLECSNYEGAGVTDTYVNVQYNPYSEPRSAEIHIGNGALYKVIYIYQESGW